MPRAGQGTGGGPARYRHGWIPANPQVAASLERIRKARDSGRVKVQDYFTMTPADKIKAAETMYGTGSRQHKEAIARFGPKRAKGR